MLTRKGENCGPRSHKLPPPGSLVTICGSGSANPRRVAVVESYGLCDSAQWRGRYVSRGIHTCTVRFLGSGARMRIAWNFLWEVMREGSPVTVPCERGSYSSYSDMRQGERAVLGHKAQRRLAAILAAKEGEKAMEARKAA